MIKTGASARVKGIIIALVLTIIVYGVLIFIAERDLKAQTKTVKVLETTGYIPVGSNINDKDVVEVKVPESIAGNLIKEKKDLKGKITVQSIGSKQYIFANSIATGEPIPKGYIEILIPTDLSRSALAFPGEYVDLMPVAGNNAAANLPPLYQKAKVRKTLDQDGRDIDPSKGEVLKNLTTGGSSVPVSVSVEIPKEPIKRISEIVKYADAKKIYLVKEPSE